MMNLSFDVGQWTGFFEYLFGNFHRNLSKKEKNKRLVNKDN